MKNLTVMLISSLLLATSCGNKDEGEPVEWILFFAFTGEAGNDFFDENSHYHPDSVKVIFNGQSMAFDDYKTLNGLHVFGLGPWGAEPNSPANNYFDFGNGDVDTLHYQWEPGTVKLRSDNFHEMEVVRLFYNDSLVLTWEPKANPDIVSEIIRRNTRSMVSPSPDNPVVISFVKRENPDEIN